MAAEDTDLDSNHSISQHDKLIRGFIEKETVSIPSSLFASLEERHSSLGQLVSSSSLSSRRILSGLFHISLSSTASHFASSCGSNSILDTLAHTRTLHRLPTIPSSWYCNNAITPHEENAILALIQLCPSSKWVSLSARKLQVYGGYVSPSGLIRKTESREHEPSLVDISTTDRLPIWLHDVVRRTHSLGISYPDYIPGIPFAYSSSTTTIHDFVRVGEDKPGKNIPTPVLSHGANHVLLNRYFPGQGIMPHVDGTSYSPLVAILSLGAPLLIHFWKAGEGERETPDNSVCAVYLEPRSLFVFADELYTGLRHGIAEVVEDAVRWKHAHLSEDKDLHTSRGMCCNVPFLSPDMRKFLDNNSTEANQQGERICVVPRLVPRYSLTIRYVKPVEECRDQEVDEGKV